MKLDKQYIIDFLKSKKELLRDEYGVTSISPSDIDFFVEFDDVDFHKLSGLFIFLEEVFKKRISLVHKHDRIKEKFLKIISGDLIRVA